MICIRCKKYEVENLVRYECVNFNIKPPEVKICKSCRVDIFPKNHVPDSQYGRIAIAYSKKYGGDK